MTVSDEQVGFSESISGATTQETTNELLSAALHYADRFGWQVLPCHSTVERNGERYCTCGKPHGDKAGQCRGKHPRTINGSTDATTDPAKIREWWAKWPNANVGIATGPDSGLHVVDPDFDAEKGKDGPSEWLKLGGPTDTPTVLTPTGGRHHYFALPAGLVLPNRKIGKAIDTRGAGGYVLAPPSIHPDGGAYQWIINPNARPLADLPAFLLSEPAPTGTPIPTPYVGQGDKSRCLAYLAELRPSIETQGGSDACLYAACTCYRFGLSESEAWECLEWYNATKCDPPWSAKELRHKLKSARAKVEAAGQFGSKLNERGDDPASFYFDAVAPEQPASGGDAEQATNGAGQDNGGLSGGAAGKTQQAGEQKPEELYGLEIIDATDVVMEDIAWTWKGRIARGGISILAGKQGDGKGVMTASLAATVSNGAEWPDGEQAERGTVLFMSAEDHIRQVLTPRLVAAGADLSRIKFAKRITEKGRDGKTVVRPFQLSDIKHLEAALRRLADVRLIIIDPIGSFLGEGTKSDKDNAVRGVLQPLADLAERYDVAPLLVAHYRKGDAFEADDKIMGSRAFVALARNVWHVAVDLENSRRLLLAGKSNNAAPAPGLACTYESTPVAGLKDPYPVAAWQDELIEMNADQWLASQRGGTSHGPKPEQASRAEEFLAATLKGRGPMLSKDVDDAAEAEAKATGLKRLANSTLARAKKKLGIASWRQWDGPDAPWVCWWPEDQTEIIDSFIRHAEAKRAAGWGAVACAN